MTLRQFLKKERALAEVIALLSVSKPTALKRLQEVGAVRVGTGPKARWVIK